MLSKANEGVAYASDTHDPFGHEFEGSRTHLKII